MPKSRAVLDQTLAEIQVNLMTLGDDVIQAVDQAMSALSRRDGALAKQVVDGDDAINDLRFDIEKACLSAIATQQPAATDLRRLVAAMNVVLDLERIGDYAAGIAKVCLRMPAESAFELPVALFAMNDLSLAMLRQVLDAYKAQDERAALAIARKDDVMDQRYQELFSGFLALIGQPGMDPESALYVLFVGHNLERIADRVTNIAERVLYTLTGEMPDLNPELDEPMGLE
jgi:phosphate transport system protein